MIQSENAFRWTTALCPAVVVLVAVLGIWGQYRSVAPQPTPSQPAPPPPAQSSPAPAEALQPSNLPPPGSEARDRLQLHINRALESHTTLASADIWSAEQRQQLEALQQRLESLNSILQIHEY